MYAVEVNLLIERLQFLKNERSANMHIFKLNGVHVPHLKKTAAMKAVRIPAPQTVTIPLSMHIGTPAQAVVKAGDTVRVGDLIGQAEGNISAPVHASVSGTVKKIDKVVLASGNTVDAVIIESDGLMTVSDSVKPHSVAGYEDFIAAVRDSGAVGLGGAGFPTAVKLDVKDTSRIKAVIINGAECEPYITSDTRTMLDDADWIRKGAELLEKHLRVKNIIIGIEKNKPECIKKMREVFANDKAVTVKELPSVYPQGGEKVLIYNTIGEIVPEGKLPIDVGAIVINCTTLLVIAKYIETGMPLVEKCITVDGSAVNEPKNVIAPIGTKLSDIFDFCGGFKSEPAKVLYGGPMMGIAVSDLDAPFLKNNNALIAFDSKDAEPKENTACINCGKCVDHCPLRLNPVAISKAFARKDADELSVLKVNLCMECGCCAYICPTGQPLVQRNRLAKELVREHHKKEGKNNG